MEDIDNILLPEINLETDDIIMNIAVKKDYSTIEDLDERKKEFINDLKAFIEEFSQAEESLEFMKYYD
jgi:inorganic pyrophosphatase